MVAVVAAFVGVAGLASASSAKSPTAELHRSILSATKTSTYPSSLESSLTTLDFDFYSNQVSPCVLDLNNGTTPGTCSFGDVASTNVVVLVGDSYAGMWYPAFNLIANRDHFHLYLFSAEGCPFARLTLSSSCVDFQNTVLARIAALKPKAIIASSMNLSPDYPEMAQFTPAQFAAGLQTMLTLLPTSSKKIELLGMPTLTLDPAECISSNLTSLQACDVSASSALISSRVHADTAAVKAAGATPVQVTSLFCAKVCPVLIAKKNVYAGRFHVTIEYASYVVRALEALLPMSKL